MSEPSGRAGADSARQRGMAYVVLSALGFGAMAILARAAYADGVDTATLLALRFGIAAAAMGALLSWRHVPVPSARDVALLMALGAVGYGGQAFTFFTALLFAPAGLVALLLYLHPALVAVLAALFLHEKMTRAKVQTLGLALAGMALTVGPALGVGDGQTSPDIAIGVALGIAAAVIYAVYIVVGTRITTRVEPLAMATIVIGSAGIVFALATLVQGPAWPRSAVGWWAVAAIALVSTVMAISLFFAGLARIGPTRASTLSTVEPVFTVLLAAVVLGERISSLQLVGGGLILVAVILLARSGHGPDPIADKRRPRHRASDSRDGGIAG